MAARAQLVRWGNSLAVRIPKNVAEDARLVEGDRLVLEVESPGKLSLKSIERPTLSQLLERISQENLHLEAEWGQSGGNEAW